MLRLKIKALIYLEKLKDVLSNKYKANAGRVSTTFLVYKIYTFCELSSGRKLYPYQEQFGKRIIRSILENDGEELTALFARQMGKTETIAVIVSGLMIILPTLANLPMFIEDKRFQMFKDGFWVGIFAPSLKQSKNTYGRLKSFLQCKSAIAILQDPDFNLEFDTSNGETVSLTNGSFATAISASDGSNIEGDSYKLIICEECQDISTFKIRKSIHPMGSAYNSTIVKIGTATTFKGDFYEAIERNKRDYTSRRLSRRNHFEYDYLVGMKYNEQYRKYVSKEKYRLGENSDEFRMSYKLEWILERGMFLNFEEVKRRCGMTKERVFSCLDKDCIVGIDLAKRSDSTVVTVVSVDWNQPAIVESGKDKDSGEVVTYKAYNTELLNWLELDGDNYDSQYYQILDFLKSYNVKRIMIDATKEEGMADRLKANLPSVEVIPCIFSDSFKSKMYKHLDSEFKTGRTKFPVGEKTVQTREYMNFEQQFSDLQKDYRGQYLVVSHPPVRDAHDDYCDSYALAVYGSREELYTCKVHVTDNKITNSSRRNNVYAKRNRFTAKRRR